MALAVAVATGMKRTLEKHPSEPSRALRARELQNPADLEERQLENIVGGMAMAGGVSQPRVLLMEGEAVKPEQAGKIVHGLRLPAFARLPGPRRDSRGDRPPARRDRQRRFSWP
jgi:hypothetical protein